LFVTGAATVLKEVYETKLEAFAAKPEKASEMAAKRSPVENVEVVGIYVLTLNKDRLVRNFEMVTVADAKRIVM
jgi:hypothetical protein